MVKTGVKDSFGNDVLYGNWVEFSYGIPPQGVCGEVVKIDGEPFVLTPTHNPDKCPLKELMEHVGAFKVAEQC